MFSAANYFSIVVEKLAKEESSIWARVVQMESELLKANNLLGKVMPLGLQQVRLAWTLDSIQNTFPAYVNLIVFKQRFGQFWEMDVPANSKIT